MGGVHGGVEELFGVHFAQAFEAFDFQPTAAHFLDAVEDFGDGEQGLGLLLFGFALEEFEEGLVLGGVLVVYTTQIGFYFGNLGASYTGYLIGETIYGYFRIGDAVGLSTVAFIITLLAALYPAILAAGMEPVEALHGGKLA